MGRVGLGHWVVRINDQPRDELVSLAIGDPIGALRCIPGQVVRAPIGWRRGRVRS